MGDAVSAVSVPPSGTPAAPLVSVIIPCRNERQHITACLESLIAQQPPEGGTVELIVADGMSSDGTREILHRLSARHPALRVVDNPEGFVSTGLNRAIAAARGEIIARADVHTEYAPDYLHQCLRVLRDSRADNVGGPWVVAPSGYVGTAIAAAFTSPFGSGGARAHDPNYEGPVDTVYLGCWPRDCFDRIGTFDEQLVRNQDDELNLRLVRAGGTVWQSPAIKSRYHPRDSLARLFRQYMQYGYWKVRVIQKHKLPASVRHLVPALFVLTILTLAVLSSFSGAALAILVAGAAAYVAASLVASLTAVPAGQRRVLPLLPLVFLCFHVGYGVGFLLGIIDFAILRRGATEKMTAITRNVGPTASP
jgi:glycosyltransferase involved in cell wall biosynthesis